ncbi:MAG TPA: UDP binding domain-containing protein, partial [bacterium]|nr:UDP binding domain-containing protein [bacterium]
GLPGLDSRPEHIKAVAEGIGSDHRINPHFLHSGIGYGGSCFPKDVDALEKLMQEHGVDAGILESARRINRGQRTRFVATVKQAMPKLRGKKIGVLGLAFKANTDDMREAPALDIIPPLLRAGAKVCAYDPVAMKNSAALLPAGVRFCDSVWDAVTGADAVLLLTEWNDFKELNFATLRRRMRGRLLFDGRNLYDPAAARRAGFVYHGIGRNGRTE